MKEPDNFLTNPVSPTTPRPYGAAKDNPGDNSGSGMTAELYNDPAYALLLAINKYKEDGISNNDESLDDPDFMYALMEALGERVDGIDDWESGTTYSAIGDLVMYKGIQYVSYNYTGNVGQIPVPGSTYWYAIPTKHELITSFQNGTVHFGMHKINDRDGLYYQQNISFGKHRLGGNGDDYYDFTLIALDGTQVTGDADLVAALGIGTVNEHPMIDIFAPESGSIRTLIDMGERSLVGQSNGSGESDTMGEEQDDRIEQHEHSLSVTGAGGALDGYASLDYLNDRLEANIANNVGSVQNASFGTTTRGKQLVNGAAYIIGMVPA